MTAMPMRMTRPRSEKRRLLGEAPRAGWSDGFRTLARLAGCQREHAAASLVRGSADMPCRERLTRRNLAGQRVVLGVRTRRTAGVDHPAHFRAGQHCGERTAAERGAQHVVEMLVNALCLPLAVDAADDRRQLLVVAAGVGDGTLEAFAQRDDDVDGQR